MKILLRASDAALWPRYGDSPKYDTRADDLGFVEPPAVADSLAQRLAAISASALSGPDLVIP